MLQTCGNNNPQMVSLWHWIYHITDILHEEVGLGSPWERALILRVSGIDDAGLLEGEDCSNLWHCYNGAGKLVVLHHDLCHVCYSFMMCYNSVLLWSIYTYSIYFPRSYSIWGAGNNAGGSHPVFANSFFSLDGQACNFLGPNGRHFFLEYKTLNSGVNGADFQLKYVVFTPEFMSVRMCTSNFHV